MLNFTHDETINGPSYVPSEKFIHIGGLTSGDVIVMTADIILISFIAYIVLGVL